MSKQMIISTVTFDEDPALTFDELCAACNVTPDFIRQLVEHGLLEFDHLSETSLFAPRHVRHIRIIKHLQQDLEVNLPGAAIVIDLLKEIDEMRARLHVLEKHIAFHLS